MNRRNVASGLSLTVGSVAGTSTLRFTYDAPAFSAQQPYNCPRSGGVSLTIAGLNLGLADETPSVQLGITGCGTVSWTSASYMLCELPLESGFVLPSWSSFLTVSAAVSTKVSEFTFDAPCHTASKENYSSRLGGLSITVLGTNFGISDLSPTVKLGSTLCSTVSWSTATLLACQDLLYWGYARGSTGWLGASTTLINAPEIVKPHVTISSLLGTSVDHFEYRFLVPTITECGHAQNNPFRRIVGACAA